MRRVASSLLILFPLLAGCQKTSTYGPGVTPQEIAAEKAIQERAIQQAKDNGGTPKLWRRKSDMRKQFERVAERIEESGAAVCRELGLPQKKRSCYYYFGLSQSPDINAHADGENIVIHTGMMRFIANDDELAAVIGHEMAHNLMDHVGAKSTNALIGMVIGGALDAVAASQGASTQGGFAQTGADIGSLSYSPEFEREADYVGLYIAARAGYDVRSAAAYWRRLSIQEPGTAEGSLTHPSNPERFIYLQKTVNEIESKRKKRMPLLPEFKPDT